MTSESTLSFIRFRDQIHISASFSSDSEILTAISRLEIFMRIHIFTSGIEKIECR